MTKRRRVPSVIQVTQTECGLCSCVAVLRYHGRAEEVSTARDSLEAGRDGLSASQLSGFLASRGMATKGYRLKTVNALQNFTSPVILYWKNYHFLVLERFDGRTATVMDPAVGRRRLSRAELEEGFSNIVITAEAGPDFVRTRRKPLSEWRALPLFPDGSYKLILMVALLSLSSYAAALGVPMLTKWAVDRGGYWQGATDLAVVVAMILATAVGYLFLHLIRVTVLSLLVARMGKHLMTYTFTKLLSLPYRFFTTRQPGELLFRLSSVNSVRDLLSSRVAQGVLDVGTLLCVGGYLFVTEWRLGAVTLALFLLNAAHLAWTRLKVVEAVDAELSGLSQSQSTQLDAIVSIPTIKMGGYADAFIDSWRGTYDKAVAATRQRMQVQQGLVTGVTTATQMFGPIMLLIMGLYFVNQGVITLGAAVAVQAVAGTFFALSTSVFQTLTEFNEVTRYLARLSDITGTPSEGKGGTVRTLGSAAITLDRVSFRYTRHSDLVVRGVSLEIPAGSKIAIVGQSGSGKSTLGRIICGLHEPTDGRVLFGGRDRDEYDIDALRRTVGYIPQEVHLHNRTILENLTMGRDISEQDAREFCREVRILDFIDDLPMGLQTMVSEMGANFSGGQRQRLAIVRALLQKPQILLMDEATASLDTVNERHISKVIDDLGVTQVIIAHRLATIRSADYIYVMSDGRVVEHGTHSDLLYRGAAYSELYADLSEHAGRPEL